MADYSDWRVGYARQARADLLAREKLLQTPELPPCQQLHFLQMACEKICKAFLCGQGVNPETLRSSHAYISGPLPVIARQYFARRIRKSMGSKGWVLAAIAALARRIERLAPAVDEGGRHPANCEYPWIGSDGAVVAPADHNFGIDILYEPAGRQLLAIVYLAAEDLMRATEPAE